MMHYFKRNIGDYHKKAGRLSMLEHGSYTLIMDACYDRERFPTLEEAIDWCWARSEEEISAVKFVLSKFFTLIDGVYTQERIADEIAAYQERAEKNKQIAIDRENKRKGVRAPDVHEACTDRHLTINQEPLTTNQEPEDQHNTHAASEADLVSEPEQIEEPAWVEEPPLPADPLLPSEMSLEWEPDHGVLAAYAKVSMVPLDAVTPDATGAFVCHYSASGRFETQAKWVQLLVAWVKRDLVSGAARNNVRQFPVKRQVNGPDFNDTTWSDDLGDL